MIMIVLIKVDCFPKQNLKAPGGHMSKKTLRSLTNQSTSESKYSQLSGVIIVDR